ncbi:MAG: IclR family transcriptional regulator [Actinomycetes bacterium]
MDKSSGVGVIDKSVAVLTALAAHPSSLAELVTATGLSRPTAHRLALALEQHGFVARDGAGRFVIGPGLRALAAGEQSEQLLAFAEPVLAELRATTGESAQLYRRRGDARVCIAAAERESGLRDTVPVGSVLPMTAGSAAQVLLAYADDADRFLGMAVFATSALAGVRRRGWAASVAEREAGVASVSAPVLDGDGSVVAAVSVSGPIERLTRTPGRRHGAAVVAAARELSRAMAGSA